MKPDTRGIVPPQGGTGLVKSANDGIEKLGNLGALYRRQYLEIVEQQYKPMPFMDKERMEAFRKLLVKHRAEREALR